MHNTAAHGGSIVPSVWAVFQTILSEVRAVFSTSWHEMLYCHLGNFTVTINAVADRDTE